MKKEKKMQILFKVKSSLFCCCCFIYLYFYCSPLDATTKYFFKKITNMKEKKINTHLMMGRLLR